MLDDKILTHFRELAIDKRLVRTLGIRDKRAIPTFVEEWLITRFQSKGSNEDISNEIFSFMSKHLPDKTEKEEIKYRLSQNETLVLLDRFDVKIDLAKNKKLVSIPCIDESKATVLDEILSSNTALLKGGQWGAGQLSVIKENRSHVIQLVKFSPMESGHVDLKQLSEAREHFTTDEWIGFLLRTMGYEPSAYTKNQQQKVILRLLPLIQNNLNMMELAPKGTGKSFIYSNLSRYTWLNSGGALTQAQLFMNLNTKEVGLLGRNDLLVLDEGQSINFKGADDIHAKFKDFLESGHYTIANKKITSECGLMILANIELFDNKPRRSDYIRHLPDMFHDDALMDRFHGILPGWEIPRFKTTSAANGYGMKADVFGQYLHQLRNVNFAEFKYGKVPSMTGDSRDVKAVKKLCSALSKLLLLNPEDVDYEEYVLNPALDLRGRVRTQLAELNPSEFSHEIDCNIMVD